MTEKLGQNHPNTIDTMENLCAVLDALDKEDESQKIKAGWLTGFEDVEDEPKSSDEESDTEKVGDLLEEEGRPLLASTLWKEDVYEAGHSQIWGSVYDKE